MIRNGFRGERGSAPAEALFVGALLGLLLIAVLQFALAVFVRNTAIEAAGSGARYGGLVGNGSDDAIRRTEALLDAQLGSGFAADVSAESAEIDGRPVLVVRVRAPLPVFGLLGPDAALDVSGHAVMERLR